jgi:methyl-accepting chemotaxis protein
LNLLTRLKIGPRLAASFAAVVALLVATAAVGILKIDGVETSTETILHDRFVKVRLAQTIENEVNRQARALRTALIAGDPAVVRSELSKIENSAPIVASAIERLKDTIHSEQGKAALATLIGARGAFTADEARLLAMIKDGQVDAGRSFLVNDMLALQTAYLSAIEAFSQTQVDGMEKFGSEAAALAAGAKWQMVALAGIAALMAVGLGAVLTRSITRPVDEAVHVAKTVAGGDLSAEIRVGATDELGQLMAALRTMNGNLSTIVRQVRCSSDSIATGTSQIAAGNADLSHRTEEQASNLQQTAASMEQMTATVRQNADAARAAAERAESATRVAALGGSVVGQVVSTMQDISDCSKKISDITSVIDGIAFQTNILALNAAVEAARAGEQGRGFAVVAGEVRSLAQRAAIAAKEIKVLIGHSTERVEVGSRLVGEAGTTMDDIVREVRQVSSLIAEIDTATRQQTIGIDQVSGAIAQLDHVTQQNSALVEESAAAAESLKRQAASLSETVHVFRLAAVTM